MKNNLILSAAIFAVLLMSGALRAQSLDELLLLADSANFTIASARLQYQAAVEKVNGSGVLPNPQLTLSVAGSHIETRLGPQQARISIMQMFPWFGSLSAEKQQEALMAQAAYHQYIAKRNNLFYEFSLGYYDLYASRKTAELLLQDIQLLNSLEETAIQQFREGKSSMVEVLKIQIRKEDQATQLALLEAKQEVLTRSLNHLLNRPADTGLAVPDTLVLKSETSGEGISGNPQLHALQHMNAAAATGVELAKKQGLPSFGIGLDYVVIGMGENLMSAENGRDAWMPMITVGLPIYRKRFRAEIRAAESRQEALQAEQEGAVNELLAEAASVDYELLEAKSTIALLEAQTEKTEQALAIQLAAYSAEGQSFSEVLETRRQLLMYRIEMEKALVAGLKAEARKSWLTNAYPSVEE